MQDTYRFPNGGYEVVVCRKQDILDCIDENIIDKEIALELVNSCEEIAATYINQGRWVGLPYIGNVRIPPRKVLENSPEQQELINEAKEVLTPNQYILFRKQLSIENSIKIKAQRYYNYITSISINRNRKLFRKLCDKHNERYARILMYASKVVCAIDNEFEKSLLDE